MIHSTLKAVNSNTTDKAGLRKPALSARILAAVEQPGYGLGWSLLLMAGSCLARAFFEGALERTGQLGFGLEPIQSQLMVFIHLPAFFFSLFLLIIILVHGISGQPIERVTRAVAAGSPVIILPVMVDRFWGGGFQLYYLSEFKQIPEFLFYTFAPWRHLAGASPGIRIEVALGCLAGAWYCWQKTRSAWRSLSAFILIFLSCILAGSLPLLFSAAWSLVAGKGAAMDGVFGPGGLVPTDTGKYALLFLLLSAGLGALWLRRWDCRLLAALMAAARPLRIIHYSGMVLLGFWVGWLAVGQSYPQAFGNPFDYLFAAAAVLAIAAVFQSAVMVNDLFDRDIDSLTGKPNPLSQDTLEAPQLVKSAAGYAAVSLAFASVLGQTAVLIVLFTHVLSLVYSAPPLRLRRFYPVSILLIALASLAACWLGFSAFGGAKTIALFPDRLTWFIMVCFGLSFATKDLNDVEGDRRAGIMTLPTVLGVKRGKAVTALLVVSAYLAGPLIIGVHWLLAASIPAGLATVWLVLKPRVREGWVFAVYFAYGAAVAWALGLHPEMLASERTRARGYGLCGLEHFYRRNYAQAAPLLDKAYDIEQDQSLLWPLARSQYGTGALEEAGQAAKAIMAKRPAFERAYHLAARVKSRQGSQAGAVGIYRQALDLGVSVRDFHQQLGDAACGQDSLETALRHYRLALASGGGKAELLSKMARIHLALGDSLKAKAQVEQALAAEPKRESDLVRAGLVFLQLGDHERVLQLAKTTRGRGGRRPELDHLRGRALEGLGRWPEAAGAYAAAIRADAGHWSSWLALSRCYLAQGRYHDANQAAARAMELEVAAGHGAEAEMSDPMGVGNLE